MVCHASLDWTYKGMRTLLLENEFLRVVSLLDKGSDIIELRYKPLDIDFMWHSPLGYRSPSTFVASSARSDGAFLDFYGGGWQDILPSAGAGISRHRGAEWGLHGETSLIPWSCSLEKEGPEEAVARLRVECYRYPFAVEKTLALRSGEKVLSIKETVSNLREQELEFSWLQHPTFGEPFLAPGCRIDVPAESVTVFGPPEFSPSSRLPAGRSFPWPDAKDKQGADVDLSIVPSRSLRCLDLAFIHGLKQGWYAVSNPQLGLGFALVWPPEVYRAIWFWQPLGGAWDHPWYGRAWAIALEPCTSWPSTGLEDQVKRGTASTIRGRGSVEVEMKAIAYTGIGKVRHVSRKGAVES